MITVIIPPPYRVYTRHDSSILVSGSTVEEAIQDLVTIYPDLRPHIQNPFGKPRPFINYFINGVNIKAIAGMQSGLQTGDVLQLIPNVAGG